MTESHILGALSKLDEFLLNPQVRTCSVAVPRTSRNSNSENRELTGDRSSDDLCPEVRYSSEHSGHLSSPEVEDYPHSVEIFLELSKKLNLFLELFEENMNCPAVSKKLFSRFLPEKLQKTSRYLRECEENVES